MTDRVDVPPQRDEDDPRRDAPTRLRALGEIARAVAGVTGQEAVVRGGAETARVALGATSVSVARWERESGRVRVLANTGHLVAGEEPSPADETYSVRDLPVLSALDDEPSGVVVDVDDPRADPAVVRLLRGRGRHSCLMVPVLVDGRAWGALQCTRGGDVPRYTRADLPYARVVAALIATGVSQAGRLERMSRLAYEDPLTGLANRRAVDERLHRAMAAHRADGTVVTLMVCDVNGLKRVNDLHGHDAGDRLLTRVGRLLGEAAAQLPGSLGARLGGDEFCLVSEGHSADEVVVVAENLCGRALDVDGGGGLACGIASTADPVGPVDSLARLFRLADAAQYRAKRSGSTRPVVAGRGVPRDPAVALADQPPVGRERRRLRGRLAVDPGALLAAALDAVDAVGTTAVDRRLEAVAVSLAGRLDAAAWSVARVASGTDSVTTVRRAVLRAPATLPGSPEADTAVVTERVLDDHPLTARALQGAGFALEVGRDGKESAEEERVAASGYWAVLAGGATAPDGTGWLLEVFTDETSAPVRALGPVARAAVATAVLGAGES